MRAIPKDILIWVHTRLVLTTYAKAASHLEPEEIARLRQTLIEEITAIQSNGELPEIWKQATTNAINSAGDSTQQGMVAYGLKRVGLLPDRETSNV